MRSAWTRLCPSLLCVEQPAIGGAVHHVAVAVIARPVARAIPGLLAGIPMDHAAEVRADRGTLFQVALLVAIHRGLGDAPADDAPVAPLDVSCRGDRAR